MPPDVRAHVNVTFTGRHDSFKLFSNDRPSNATPLVAASVCAYKKYRMTSDIFDRRVLDLLLGVDQEAQVCKLVQHP